MPKTIVSNTGPLISLEKLGDRYEFMGKIYQKIIIPEKVAEEISSHYSSFDKYISRYSNIQIIEVRQVQERIQTPDIDRLDDGEIEAISLAYQLKQELLIEEIQGRKIAHSLGIKISGIAGAIGNAYLQGIIEKNEAVQKLQRLLSTNRINRNVHNEILTMIEHKA